MTDVIATTFSLVACAVVLYNERVCVCVCVNITVSQLLPITDQSSPHAVSSHGEGGGLG